MLQKITRLAWAVLFLNGMLDSSRAQISTNEYVNPYRRIYRHYVRITFFPVHGFESIASTFGPRLRAQENTYDFHRGMDIPGQVGDLIVAPCDGIFWGVTTTETGGYTLLLQHDLPRTVALNGHSFDHFYTRYSHLNSDTELGNGIGTDDIVAGWIPRTTVVTGAQVIAELGRSGITSNSVPHLHMELRVGTPFSPQFQVKPATPESSVTGFGFEPHMHPMLLFEPYRYGASGMNRYRNSFLLSSSVLPSNDILLRASSSTDHMPLLNRIECSILNDDNMTIAHHVLDYNLRDGFDITSDETLDQPMTNLPYIVPIPFGVNATNFRSHVTVPKVWLESHGVYDSSDYTLRIDLWDIWMNHESLTFPIPKLNTQLVIYRPSSDYAWLLWNVVPGRTYGLETSTNSHVWSNLPRSTATAQFGQDTFMYLHTITNLHRSHFRVVHD